MDCGRQEARRKPKLSLEVTILLEFALEVACTCRQPRANQSLILGWQVRTIDWLN
jgi:hypothetical protein